MKYKFTEVLNDLVNYFLLGDIQLLEEWKRETTFRIIWQWNLQQLKVRKRLFP